MKISQVALLLGAARAIVYDCQDDLFPFVYGRGDGATFIASQANVQESDHLLFFLGGHTKAQSMKCDGGEYSTPKAIIMRQKVYPPGRAVGKDNSITHMRHFNRNTNMRKITQVLYYEESSSNRRLIALGQYQTIYGSETSLYVSIMNADDLNEIAQRKVRWGDCYNYKTAQWGLHLPFISSAGDLVIPYSSYAYEYTYGPMAFQLSRIAANDVRTYNSDGEIKRIACKRRLGQKHCIVSSSAESEDRNYYYLAAVFIESDDKISQAVHTFRTSDHALMWTAKLKSNQRSNYGTPYHYQIESMCHKGNNLVGLSVSPTQTDASLIQFEASGGAMSLTTALPTISYDPGSTSKGLALRCSTATEGFALLSHASKTFSLIKYSFGSPSSYTVFLYDTENPFKNDASHRFFGAAYLDYYSTDEFQFIMYGGASLVNLPGHSEESLTTTHGFLMPLDSTNFDSCVSLTTPAESTPVTSSSTVTWDLLTSSQFPLSSTSNNEYNYCISDSYSTDTQDYLCWWTKDRMDHISFCNLYARSAGAMQFAARTTQLNENAFTADFPTLTNVPITGTLLTTAFQPFEIDDGAGNTCKTELRLSWEAVDKTDANRKFTNYPAFSWNHWTPQFKIDMRDSAENYLGEFDVTLKGSMRNGDFQEVTFSAINHGLCRSPYNTVRVNALSDYTYQMFDSVRTSKVISWTTTRTYSRCTEPLTLKVQIQMNGAGPFVDIDSSELATKHLATYLSSSPREFTLQTDVGTYGYDDYASLRGSHKLRILVFNQFQGATPINTGTTDFNLHIKGCLVSSITAPIPKLSFTVYGPIVQQTFPLWTVDDGEGGSECSISMFLVMMPSNTISHRPVVRASTDLKLSVSQTEVPDNEIAGQTYDFELVARVVRTNPSFVQYRRVPFQLEVIKNCQPVIFDTTRAWFANHQLVSSQNYIYALTEPTETINFLPWIASDAFCEIGVELTASKLSPIAAPVLTADLATFVSPTILTVHSTSITIHNADSLPIVGTYTLEIKATIDPLGSNLVSDTLLLSLEVRHWCWLVQIHRFPLANKAFPHRVFSYVQNQTQVMNPWEARATYFHAQFPSFQVDSFTFDGTTYSELSLEAECGPWAYELQYTKSDGTKASVAERSNIFDFNQGDNLYHDFLSLSLHSGMSEAQSSQGWVIEPLTLHAHLTDYPAIEQEQAITLVHVDPCWTFHATPGRFAIGRVYQSLFSFPVLQYKPLASALIVNFEPYTEQITEYKPATYVIQNTHINSEFCGALVYEVVNRTAPGNPVADPRLVSVNPLSSSSGMLGIRIQTEAAPLYNLSSHSLSLRVRLPTMGYPEYFFDFRLEVTQCLVTSVIFPDISEVPYYINSGQQTLSIPLFEFQQQPPCNHRPHISSRWANGTDYEMPASRFEVDYDFMVVKWIIDVSSSAHEGLHPVEFNYSLPDNEVPFQDNSFRISLNFIKDRQLLEHKPPHFLDPGAIPEEVTVYLGDSFKLNSGLPSEDTVRLDFEVVSSIPNWADFTTYAIDSQKYSLELEMNPNSPDHLGELKLFITLTDNGSDNFAGPSFDNIIIPKQKTYQVRVKIKEAKEPEPAPPPPSPEEPKDNIFGGIEDCIKPPSVKTCIPEASLEEVGFDGILELSFTHYMLSPDDLFEWKGVNAFLEPESVENIGPLQIAVAPGLEQDPARLGFTWRVLALQHDKLKIQLNFSDPLFVSGGVTKDTLTISIEDPAPLKSASTTLPVKKGSFSTRLVPQMPSGQVAARMMSTADSLEGGMQQAVIVNFAINVALSGSLQYLWSMINALQIVFHLPGNHVTMPANANMIYGKLITVTQFNLIPEEWMDFFKFWKNFESSPSSTNSRRSLKEVFKGDFDKTTNYNEELIDIGYEAYFLVDNLETLLVLIQAFLFLGLSFLVIKAIRKWLEKSRRRKSQKLIKALEAATAWLDGFLFWNVPLRFLLEGYLELAIISLVNLKPVFLGKQPVLASDSADGKVHESLSNSCALVMLAILIFVPFFIVFHSIRVSEEDLHSDQKMKDRVGSIYEGSNLRSKRGVSYNAIFTLRRLFLAACLVFLSDQPSLQLGLFQATQLGLFFYFGSIKPREWSIQNKFELANEFLTLIISYHLLMFTDYYRDFEVRYYYVGFSMIAWTGIIILLNMSLLFKSFYAQLIAAYWICRKKLQSRRRKVAVEDPPVEPLKKQWSATSLTSSARIRCEFVKAVKAKRNTYLRDLHKMKEDHEDLNAMQERHFTDLINLEAIPSNVGDFSFGTQFEDDSLDSQEIELQYALELQGTQDLNPKYKIFAEAVRHEQQDNDVLTDAPHEPRNLVLEMTPDLNFILKEKTVPVEKQPSFVEAKVVQCGLLRVYEGPPKTNKVHPKMPSLLKPQAKNSSRKAPSTRPRKVRREDDLLFTDEVKKWSHGQLSRFGNSKRRR